MSFKFDYFDVPGPVRITPQIFADDRGFFLESYKKSAFLTAGIDVEFLQCNQSLSRKNVVRGLHYQKSPHEQGKLIKVLQGSIFDVAVDLRADSATFGMHVGVNLCSEDMQLFFIPAGFAHGFCVLSDTALIEYFTTGEYVPESDTGILWNSPDLKIDWPVLDPVLSVKDQRLPEFGEVFGRSKISRK